MTAFIEDEFAAPASAAGFVWSDHKGALLIIEPTAVEAGIPTSFGEKEAVRADIRVVDGPDAGEVYTDTLIFPRALIGQLKSNVGRKVLGRVSQGQAKPGQQAPWLLSDPTPADVAAAKAALAGKAAPAAAPAAPF